MQNSCARRTGRLVTGLFWTTLFALLTTGFPRVGLPAEELTGAEFRRLREELRPAAGEPWRTIPWKIGLLDAQRSAAQEKKPIFIWAMDGHPLGCT